MEVERVQALSHGGLHELPAQFIRLPHERPENSKAVEGVTIPVISFSQPHDVVVEEIFKACSEWGFFLLTDHEIEPSLIGRLKEVGEEFFKLPQKEKESYANDPSTGSFEGYGTKMTRNLDEKVEWVDYYFHFTSPPSRVNLDIWPKNPPSYRIICIALLLLLWELEEFLSNLLQPADQRRFDLVIGEKEKSPFTTSLEYFFHHHIVRLRERDHGDRDPFHGLAVLGPLVGFVPKIAFICRMPRFLADLTLLSRIVAGKWLQDSTRSQLRLKIQVLEIQLIP
ncbi:hypothetical protein Acr_04g0000690 [Actinidia rufa]|uniref:Non-haem dioxygenase N-terminal domain-containing protein n=1 Tax=Actinidia rufa TaxID=165716 RepID=A0A7J0EFU7_9ERIC|nr:hypothetical protein Acr_04g0000690 [Actinidia rufa]